MRVFISWKGCSVREVVCFLRAEVAARWKLLRAGTQLKENSLGTETVCQERGRSRPLGT